MRNQFYRCSVPRSAAYLDGSRRSWLVALAALLSALPACGTESPAAELTQQPGTSGSSATQAPERLALVDHPENIQLGIPKRPGSFLDLRNPYAGNKQRIAEGAALFVSYNCADCHGDAGSGGMGPSLADGRWHFGGSDGAVFESIYEGRPAGMPEWGGRIDDSQIWSLVAYVQSLNAGKDVSTVNFTGATVKRTGH